MCLAAGYVINQLETETPDRIIYADTDMQFVNKSDFRKMLVSTYYFDTMFLIGPRSPFQSTFNVRHRNVYPDSKAI